MAHILVVDDEPQVRTMLVLTLRQAGYTVSEADDGEAALRIIGHGQIDLVVLDLIMPGKEGLETLTALRRGNQHPYVIAVSGGARSMDADFLPIAAKLGAHATLKKPFDNDVLLDRIRVLLGEAAD
ncbi:MAG: response regulator [Candidatus Hydrogenedentes bacterium]|nr:response regulator [Candidatus Hydrogenedentota bacterium]